MVLVRDNRVAPLYWKLARVHKLLPDKHGNMRIVEVIRAVYGNENYPSNRKAAMEDRLEIRHINQLAPLPVNAEEREELSTSLMERDTNENKSDQENDNSFEHEKEGASVNEV